MTEPLISYTIRRTHPESGTSEYIQHRGVDAEIMTNGTLVIWGPNSTMVIAYARDEWRTIRTDEGESHDEQA